MHSEGSEQANGGGWGVGGECSGEAEKCDRRCLLVVQLPPVWRQRDDKDDFWGWCAACLAILTPALIQLTPLGSCCGGTEVGPGNELIFPHGLLPGICQ